MAWRFLKPDCIIHYRLRGQHWELHSTWLWFLGLNNFSTCLQPNFSPDHEMLKCHAHSTLNGLDLRRAVLAQCSFKLSCVLCSPTDKYLLDFELQMLCSVKINVTLGVYFDGIAGDRFAFVLISMPSWYAWEWLFTNLSSKLYHLSNCKPNFVKKRTMELWGRAGITPCHLGVQPSLDGVADAAGFALQCHLYTVVCVLWWEGNLPYPLWASPLAQSLLQQSRISWYKQANAEDSAVVDVWISIHVQMILLVLFTLARQVPRALEVDYDVLTLRASELLGTVEALSSLQQWNLQRDCSRTNEYRNKRSKSSKTH